MEMARKHRDDHAKTKGTGTTTKGTGTFTIDIRSATVPALLPCHAPRELRWAGSVTTLSTGATADGRKVDYQASLKALAHACIEIPMSVLAFCLMLNPFHLAVLPKADGDLSRWMHWVLLFTPCEMLGPDNSSRRWLKPSV